MESQYPQHSGYDKVFSVLDAIEATTKRTEKSKLLHGLAKSKAARMVFWLAMNRDKFYVTAKTVKAASPKVHYADTDAAFAEFTGLLWRLSHNELSGNAAKKEVIGFFANLKHKKSGVHSSTHKWCLRILDKKLRIGVDTTVHEVWPGIVEVFGVAKGMALVKQKTGEFDKRALKLISYPCDVEPKKDGFNISFKCDMRNNTATALSSDGLELPALQGYADVILAKLKTVKLSKRLSPHRVLIVDGEAEAKYDISSKDDAAWNSSWGKCSALCKAGIKKTGFDAASMSKTICRMIMNDLVVTLYDIYPPTAHVALFECHRKKRRDAFESIAKHVKKLKFKLRGKETKVVREDAVVAIPYKTCQNFKEVQAYHAKCIDHGEEGSIIRMPNVGVIADSKTRTNYVKYKEYGKIDAVILGVEEGEGRNAGTSGAFVCWVPSKKKISRVTVPTDAVKAWVWKHRKIIHGFWLEVIEAKDATSSNNASRNPVFARFRDDQLPMSLEEVIEVCKKNKLPLPKKDNMGVKLFCEKLSRISI